MNILKEEQDFYLLEMQYYGTILLMKKQKQAPECCMGGVIKTNNNDWAVITSSEFDQEPNSDAKLICVCKTRSEALESLWNQRSKV